MATTSGSSSSYLDLLDKFDDFVTTLGSNPWSQLKATYSLPSTDGEANYQLEGTDAAKEIYINIGSYHDDGGDYHNWKINGATGWDTALTVDTQPGAIPTKGSYLPPRLLLDDETIYYNFIANGQRAIIVARCGGTVVLSAYLGFIIPYMPFDYFPYPLFIGGSACYDIRYSKGDTQVQPFWRAMSTGGHAALRILANWHYLGAGTGYQAIKVFPAEYLAANPTLLSTTADSGYLLHPMVLMMYDGQHGYAPVGEFDGVYWLSGYNVTHGDIITISGTDYMVIQDTYRTGMNDYAAIKLV